MENNSVSSLIIVGLIAIALTGTVVIGSQMMPLFGFGYGMHGNGMMMHGGYDDNQYDYDCDMDDIHSEEECEEYYEDHDETGLSSDHEFEECEEHMHEQYGMGYGCP